MNSEMKKQVAVGAMLVALVGILLYQFVLKSPGGSSSTTRQRSASTTSADADKVALMKVDVDLDALLSGIEVVNFVYENEKIDRDPMTPVRPIPKAGEEGDSTIRTPRESEKMRMVYDMKVTGIVYNEFRPMAIVDNKLVTIGHEYGDGVRIVAIDRERVWFDVDDARVPLELKEL